MNSIKHFSLIALSATMSFGAFADGTKKTAEEMRGEVNKAQTDYIAEGTKLAIGLGVGAGAVHFISSTDPERQNFMKQGRAQIEVMEKKIRETEQDIINSRNKIREAMFNGDRELADRISRNTESLNSLLDAQHSDLYKLHRSLHQGHVSKPKLSTPEKRLIKMALKVTGVVLLAAGTKKVLDLLLDPSRTEVTPDKLPEGVSIVHPNDPSYAKLSEQALDLDLLAKDPNGIKKLTDMGLPQADAAAVIAKVNLQTPSTKLVEEEISSDSPHNNANTNLN